MSKKYRRDKKVHRRCSPTGFALDEDTGQLAPSPVLREHLDLVVRASQTGVPPSLDVVSAVVPRSLLFLWVSGWVGVSGCGCGWVHMCMRLFFYNIVARASSPFDVISAVLPGPLQCSCVFVCVSVGEWAHMCSACVPRPLVCEWCVGWEWPGLEKSG